MSFHRVKTYLELLVMVWAIWQTADTPNKVLGLMQAYVVGGMVVTAATLSSLVSGNLLLGFRALAGLFDPNELALGIAMTIPFALHWLRSQTKQHLRVLLGIFVTLGFLAIAATGSRGGVLAALVPLSMAIALFMRGIWLRRAVSSLLTLALGCALVLQLKPTIPDPLWIRLLGIPGELSSGRLSGRTEIWALGHSLLQEHWLWGIGAGAFEAKVTPYFGRQKAPHNTFLAVFVEMGLVGGSLFCLLLAHSVMCAVRSSPPARWALLAALACWLAGAQALGLDYRKPIWLLMALASCLHATSTTTAHPGTSTPRPTADRPISPLAATSTEPTSQRHMDSRQ